MKTTTGREYTGTITMSDEEAKIIARALEEGVASICKSRQEGNEEYYDYIKPAKELRDLVGSLVNIYYMGLM